MIPSPPPPKKSWGICFLDLFAELGNINAFLEENKQKFG